MTIAGQSAGKIELLFYYYELIIFIYIPPGGSAVTYLMDSPLASGLFHGVIASSGND